MGGSHRTKVSTPEVPTALYTNFPQGTNLETGEGLGPSFLQETSAYWVDIGGVDTKEKAFLRVPGLVWDGRGGTGALSGGRQGNAKQVCSEGGLFCPCVGGREAE